MFYLKYAGREVTGLKKFFLTIVFLVLITMYFVFVSIPALLYYCVKGYWPNWFGFAVQLKK